MLSFLIANLLAAETKFEVAGILGKWEFEKAVEYASIEDAIVNRDMCGNTYSACLMEVSARSPDAEFSVACDEAIDICAVLSFVNARCVTVSGTGPWSDISLVQPGDDFMPARSITGFPAFFVPKGLSSLFAAWATQTHTLLKGNNGRAFLKQYISALTCYSLEDLVLALGVLMDMVKQEERRLTCNQSLVYYDGMTSASLRYGLTPLSRDYVKMRNDMIHQGTLSGDNFRNKSKAECASVTRDVLNWIDRYMLAVLNLESSVGGVPRWKAQDVQYGLVSSSVR